MHKLQSGCAWLASRVDWQEGLLEAKQERTRGWRIRPRGGKRGTGLSSVAGTGGTERKVPN